MNVDGLHVFSDKALQAAADACRRWPIGVMCDENWFANLDAKEKDLFIQKFIPVCRPKRMRPRVVEMMESKG